jgi:hypothetical protein
MTNHNLQFWLEAIGDVPPANQPPQPDSQAPVDPNVAQQQPAEMAPEQPVEPQMPDVSSDPQSAEIPDDKEHQDFEQWKNTFFKESIRGDVNKLIDMIHEVRDLELDSYPRKFVEDNLQVLFLCQHANIAKASKEIRRLIRQELDKNNPSVSLVNHITSVLETMQDLSNIFIKLKGMYGLKGDLHRKYIAALLGAIQVGSGGNTEDVIYNEKDYSIRISTRFNNEFGRLEMGRWSLKEDDPDKFLEEAEMKRLEEGSPDEREALRHRIVIESIVENFKTRTFVANVVDKDGTVMFLGWDIASSLQAAFTEGKLVVKTILSENSEVFISESGEILPYVDLKIQYMRDTGELDEDGKPAPEEHPFIEKIDGILFLTANMNIIKEAASSMQGIVLKEIPFKGNPSEIKILEKCHASANELLLRMC